MILARICPATQPTKHKEQAFRRFRLALTRRAMGLKCPESEQSMYTESERQANKDLSMLLKREGLTSCFTTNAKILAKRKQEFVDVTQDCQDKDRQAILAKTAQDDKLRYCHECQVYHVASR